MRNPLVEEVTAVKVVAMHHDITTVTGEEVVLFILARSPDLCEAKMNIALLDAYYPPITSMLSTVTTYRR